MAAKVKVSGVIVVFNHIPALIAAVEANSYKAPKRVADKIAATAKGLAPVDTGALKDSIHSVSVGRGKEAEIKCDVGYAAYVEFGTHKMAAQPFLYPAVMKHQKEFMIEVGTPLAAAM